MSKGLRAIETGNFGLERELKSLDQKIASSGYITPHPKPLPARVRKFDNAWEQPNPSQWEDDAKEAPKSKSKLGCN
jgi:hypothetical protein